MMSPSCDTWPCYIVTHGLSLVTFIVYKYSQPSAINMPGWNCCFILLIMTLWCIILPSPSRCIFPSLVSKLSSWTHIGRQCRIHSCITLTNGLHFTHSLFYSFDSSPWSHNSQLSAQSVPPPLLTCHPNDYDDFNMPRRHRMHCQQGSGHGHASHPPLSLHSESHSPPPNENFAHYPSTRSGNGRGRAPWLPCSFSPDENLAQRHGTSHVTNHGRGRGRASPPMQSFHPETRPLLPEENSMQFHYTYALDHPRLTATITIIFKEDASLPG